MNTRISVEIVRSTPKAHLVKAADGRSCWVQKRWLGSDNTVAAATFERGASAIEEKQEIADATKQFKSDYHAVVVIEEREKAVCCNAAWHRTHTESGATWKVWLPKSQLRDGKAPGWLLLAKAEELGRQIMGAENHESVTIASIGLVPVLATVYPAAWGRRTHSEAHLTITIPKWTERNEAQAATEEAVEVVA